MCQCIGSEFKIIGQILNNNKKKPITIYYCPKCKTSYIHSGKGYKQLTPNYFLSDL